MIKNPSGHKAHYQLLVTLFIFFVFGTNSIHAQSNITLSGKVVDNSSKLPLAGATVHIKGITHEVVTNNHGEFSFLTGQRLPVTYIISYVGYQAQEATATVDRNFTIALEQNNLVNDAVVVIGYGTQKRSDFTGSLASVSGKSLSVSKVSSPERLLQGAISGVLVTQNSGQPGGGVTVRVRGGTSITAGNEPLYVIDGFPVYNGDAAIDAGVTNGPKINPLSTINSSDIESIDVLKDASATAIYGSRGANGVVLITTKKGKPNQASVSYDAYYGVQKVIRTIPLLDAQQWVLLKNDALNDSQKAPLYSEEEIRKLGKGTDWQEEAFTPAPIQNHSLTFTAGTDKTRLTLSGNYYQQEGVLQNTGFGRYSGRLNLDHTFSGKFRLGAFITGSSTKANVAPDAVVPNILLMPPVIAVRDQNGNFTLRSNFETSVANPVNTLYNQVNTTNTNRFLVNGFGEYTIVEGVTSKVLAGADIIGNKQNHYLPATVFEGLPGGIASVGSLSAVNWLNENTLNFKRVFAGKHSLDALAGFTQQQSVTEVVTAGSSNFASDEFTYNNLGSGTILAAPASLYSKWALRSYLGRVNYGFNDKYFLTLTVRADGSSRFGDDNKWGTFPSAAIAWNVSQEKFLKGLPAISSLKFRLSAGLTGNQEIAPYQSLARLAYFRYNFANTLVGGFAPASYGNKNLGWEKTTQYNLGVDLGLRQNRINLVTDIYYKRTNDLLLEVPLPYASGLESAFQNYGSVENKGIELSISTKNLAGELQWNTQLIYSANRNKVLSLGPGRRALCG